MHNASESVVWGNQGNVEKPSRESVILMWKDMLQHASKLPKPSDSLRASLDAEKSRIMTLEKQVKSEYKELAVLEKEVVSQEQKERRLSLVQQLENEVRDLKERNKIFEDLYREMLANDETPGNPDSRLENDPEVLIKNWVDLHNQPLPVNEPHKPVDPTIKHMNREQTIEWIKDTLNLDDYEGAIKKPDHTSEAEWNAIAIELFTQDIALVWEAISQYCTSSTCPIMTAGPTVKYLWQDPYVPTYIKPTAVFASQYVDLLMAWINRFLHDDTIFVSENSEKKYPNDFLTAIVPKLYRRLFRVYGHIYHHHFKDVDLVGTEWTSHLNASFKHFIMFGQKWNLLNDNDAAPLKPLIHIMTKESPDRFVGQKLTRDYKTLTKAQQYLNEQRIQKQQAEMSAANDRSMSSLTHASEFSELDYDEKSNYSSSINSNNLHSRAQSEVDAALMAENLKLQKQIDELREQQKSARGVCTSVDGSCAVM